MTKTRQHLAIGQSDPALRPFQGLNGWFFIDGKDERILGRIEIKTNNVDSLASKLRVIIFDKYIVRGKAGEEVEFVNLLVLGEQNCEALL